MHTSRTGTSEMEQWPRALKKDMNLWPEQEPLG